MTGRIRQFVFRITRDMVVLTVGLGLGIYEVLGEGRPAVLAFLGALIASPIVMRVDEARRERNRDDSDRPAD